MKTSSKCFIQILEKIKRKVKVVLIVHVQLFATPWTVTCQAPPSIGLSRQEYWCGLPCPSPGDLNDRGIKPTSVISPALAGGFFTINAT